ncbi:MAG: hypothetical protein KGP28_07075 [Bdellovibrionales bacterium]|nr:hypothetical protein [Bdellovibrionales bacterium]
MRLFFLPMMGILLFNLAAFAQKPEKKGAVDLSSASTISDVLNELRGKTVLLRLNNGSSIEGTLSKKMDPGSPHSQLVSVEQISGKEMHSAMILKSSIIGVEYRH